MVERVTFGPETSPVPVRLIACGLTAASSVIVSVAVLAPGAVGVNVTLMVQLAPAATVEPQVFVWAKSPLAAMLVMSKEPVPMLVRITACGALDVETIWAAKLRLVGESPTPEVGA